MNTDPIAPTTQGRLAWVGVALGVACMIGLICFGFIAQRPQVVVIACSTIAVLVGIGAGVQGSTARRAGGVR